MATITARISFQHGDIKLRKGESREGVESSVAEALARGGWVTLDKAGPPKKPKKPKKPRKPRKKAGD